MVDPFKALEPRWFSIAALIFFVPVVLSFGLSPHAWWVEYLGIWFHLAMFMLVAKLDAPDWAKAAGYGWLLVDVTTGVMSINGVSHSITAYVRLGGHIFGGIWITTASLSGSRPIKIVGALEGISLFGYSFLSPFVPEKALSATAFLYLIWLGLISWQNGTRTSLVPATDR